MIDSSLGQHQIQMAAIRQAISDGRLNAATLHQIMLDEISKELEKPLKEVDMDYVNTCDHLLELLNRDRNCMVDSFYDRNLIATVKRCAAINGIRTTGRSECVWSHALLFY